MLALVIILTSYYVPANGSLAMRRRKRITSRSVKMPLIFNFCSVKIALILVQEVGIQRLNERTSPEDIWLKVKNSSTLNTLVL